MNQHERELREELEKMNKHEQKLREELENQDIMYCTKCGEIYSGSWDEWKKGSPCCGYDLLWISEYHPWDINFLKSEGFR